MRMNVRKASSPAGSRRATNLSLAAELVDEANAIGVSLSRAAEHGIALAIAEERARRWREDNREAIDSANAYVEARGLPLGRFRQF